MKTFAEYEKYLFFNRTSLFANEHKSVLNNNIDRELDSESIW